MKSWKSEVIADRSGKWYSNGVRFATKQEADDYGRDLMGRWTLVTDVRSTEADEPVTHLWQDGEAKEAPVVRC